MLPRRGTGTCAGCRLSRHRGSSRRPASVERVEWWDTADRATNIDRTGWGPSSWELLSVRAVKDSLFYEKFAAGHRVMPEQCVV